MKIFLKCGIKFIEVILDLAQLAEVGTYNNIESVKHIFGNPVGGVLSTFCVHRYLFSASHALVHHPNLLSD
jgi:hypothetical protein